MFIGKIQLAVDRDFVRVKICNVIESSRLQTVLSISEFDYYPLKQICQKDDTCVVAIHYHRGCQSRFSSSLNFVTSLESQEQGNFNLCFKEI